MTVRRSNQPQQVSRREVLRVAGGAGAALAVGAATAHGTAAQSSAATPPPLASSGQITIQDTGVQLPSEPVTFQWMVRGLGPKGSFFEQFFPVYQQAHPNITIDYLGLPPAELTQILPLGIQNGQAPDCFEAPESIPGYQMVREGWVRPLDDLIPNFEAWKQRIPPGVLVEGVTVFDGQTYAFPYLSNKDYSTLTLYNVEYLQRAGYDPSVEPLTWDTFRAAARTITEQGQGQYYGYIIGGQQAGRWGAVVSNLAQMAGAAGGEFNWQTGEYNYTREEILAAIELFLAMRDDGSIFPGSLQLDNAQARARTTQGAAGIILQGGWNIPDWQREVPDFQFGVASQPLPNAGTPLPMGIGPGAFLPVYVYAESQHPEIAGDIFAYLASEEGQLAFASITGGFPLPILPSVREQAVAAGLDPRMLKAHDLFEEQLRVAPDPRVRNPDAAQVYLELRPITPDFGETVQGLYTGQLENAQQAMQDLQNRADAELDRAIQAAQAAGAEVTRDDWVFPNWEPTEDYTEEDYAAL